MPQKYHRGIPYFELKVLPIDPSGSQEDWDEATNMYYYDYDEETDTPETYNGTRAVIIALIVLRNIVIYVMKVRKNQQILGKYLQ